MPEYDTPIILHPNEEYSFIIQIEPAPYIFTVSDTSSSSNNNGDSLNDNTNYDPAAMDKLFRFVAIDAGDEIQRTIKISISDIKASLNPTEQPYGTFTVEVRAINDTDGSKKVLESETRKVLL